MIKNQQKCITNSGSFTIERSGLFKYYGLILFFSILTGLSEQSIQKLEGSAQGTTYHISYWSELPMDGNDIEISIKNELDIIDKTLSNYRPDSIIETFNSTENTDSQEVGQRNCIIGTHRTHRSSASQGCFDLTIKPLFELWVFGAMS